jgi:ABC-type bacteriocin/lantibiotic exporter with double-glycine peptidase domain
MSKENSPFGRFVSALAFVAALAGGIYLVMNDHVTLGAWVCILSLIGNWGFEK